MTPRYAAYLDRLDEYGRQLRVLDFSLSEFRTGGWFGYATVEAGTSATPMDAFRVASGNGFLPGVNVALRLVRLAADEPAAEGEEEPWPTEDTAVRVWPSVIARVTAGSAGEESFVYRLRLLDVYGYLSDVPIWGAFHNARLGEIVGGALSLAAGGDGRPTLAPALPGLPKVEILPRLRASLDTVPYAIATGEPLRVWLRNLFGRLGVRMEMSWGAGDATRIELFDRPPDADTVRMSYDDASESFETFALPEDMRAFAQANGRATLLDNQITGDPRSTGMAGAVGEIITAAGTGLDEATLRGGFGGQRAELSARLFTVATVQPLARPGVRLEFDNQPVDGSAVWQVGDVVHAHARDIYVNRVMLQKGDAPWRPRKPADAGPVFVSGIVDDGVSEPGAAVERDREGRIPVTLAALPRRAPPSSAPADAAHDAADDAADDAAESSLTPDLDEAEWTVPIPLPVVSLAGGRDHGFIGGRRQGDTCRIVVHHPMFAEIAGFGYREDRRIGAAVTDSTSGLVVRHRGDGWSGLLFRPHDEIEEAENESGE